MNVGKIVVDYWKNKIWTEVPIDEITIGSWVLVKPGGQIPVDGIVLEGNSFVDESSITGEPVPIEKKSGDKVMGATINKNGQLIIQAESLGNETIYSRIIKIPLEKDPGNITKIIANFNALNE